MKHLLDRPIWSALATRHAPLAEGAGLAKRYPPSVSPFAATARDDDDSLHALGTMTAPGVPQALLMADEIRLPDGLQIEKSAAGVQMMAGREFERVDDERVQALSADDAEEMLTLARLTEPGPFSLKALCLGRFWGVRENGRLIAMAGERLKQPGYTELSGLCTHPDYRKRGLGRLLLKFAAGEICAVGDVPYLHAYAANTKAIALYEAIGFKHRTDVNVAFIARRG